MEVFQLGRSIPVTATLFAAFGLVMIAVTFNVVTPFDLLFSNTLVFEQKQYWRMITTFLFCDEWNYSAILYLTSIIHQSHLIESQYFFNRPLDYSLVLILVSSVFLFLRSVRIIDEPFMIDMLYMFFIYLSSRLTPEAHVQIFFFEVVIRILPYLIWLFNFFFYSALNPQLICAFSVAHVIWYVLEIVPRITGIDLFKVQRFLVHR